MIIRCHPDKSVFLKLFTRIDFLGRKTNIFKGSENREKLMKVRSESKKEKESRPAAEIWELTLYVAGQTLKSITALTNLKRICHEHLKDKCHIKVIDLAKNPEIARKMEIVAVPTLVKTIPPPIRRVIGNLSDTERVLVQFGLR